MSRRKNPSEGDFQGLLRRGLSGNLDYITLKQKARSPVFLQFKPFISRVNSMVIYVGGKLSAFPDFESQKFLQLVDVDQIELLKSAWKKLPQDRVSPRRVGSNAGFHVIAGIQDGAVFATKFDKGHMVHRLLAAIEEAMGIEIDNKDEVVGYLSLKYHSQLKGVFSSKSGVAKTPDRVVGKKTECLLGQNLIWGFAAINAFLESLGLADASTEEADESDGDEEDDEDQDEAA